MIEIAIGLVVSLIVQGVKHFAGSNRWLTIAILGGLSLLGAGVYHYLVSNGYWEAVATILLTAAGIWAVLIKPLEK